VFANPASDVDSPDREAGPPRLVARNVPSRLPGGRSLGNFCVDVGKAVGEGTRRESASLPHPLPNSRATVLPSSRSFASQSTGCCRRPPCRPAWTRGFPCPGTSSQRPSVPQRHRQVPSARFRRSSDFRQTVPTLQIRPVARDITAAGRPGTARSLVRRIFPSIRHDGPTAMLCQPLVPHQCKLRGPIRGDWALPPRLQAATRGSRSNQSPPWTRPGQSFLPHPRL